MKIWSFTPRVSMTVPLSPADHHTSTTPGSNHAPEEAQHEKRADSRGDELAGDSDEETKRKLKRQRRQRTHFTSQQLQGTSTCTSRTLIMFTVIWLMSSLIYWNLTISNRNLLQIWKQYFRGIAIRTCRPGRRSPCGRISRSPEFGLVTC